MNNKRHINLSAFLVSLLALAFGCAQDTSERADPVLEETQNWVHEHAQVYGEIPKGWTLTQPTTESWHFSRHDAPGHTLSIQQLTTNIGRSPLKILRQTIKEHPYFTDFEYESKWEKRIDSAWAPAFHATYFYLNEPAVRYGLLLPTANGYYEVSYHAPFQPIAAGIAGYERLVDSITVFVDD